jgi:membrane protein
MAPLLVILLAIAGSVLGEQTAYSQLQAQLQGLFGPATAKTVMGAVEASKHAQGWIATLISIVTLLIGASTVLNALQTALDQIWQSSQIAPGGWRGIVRSRLLSFTACLAGVRDAAENEASVSSHSAPSAVAGRSSTSSA